jgi:hypothetical protein
VTQPIPASELIASHSRSGRGACGFVLVANPSLTKMVNFRSPDRNGPRRMPLPMLYVERLGFRYTFLKMDSMRAAYDEVYAYAMGRPGFILQHVVDAFAVQSATPDIKTIGVVSGGG